MPRGGSYGGGLTDKAAVPAAAAAAATGGSLSVDLQARRESAGHGSNPSQPRLPTSRTAGGPVIVPVPRIISALEGEFVVQVSNAWA